MSRLIAFGCSYTYGHGLPDCTDETGLGAGNQPSQFAWPKLLADKLDLDILNMSKPGAGNTEILWKILNFKFDPDDFCVIMWSYFIRAEYYRYAYNSEGTRIPMDVYNPKLLEDARVFDEHNKIVNLLAMSHASYYLEKLGITSYACTGPIGFGLVSGIPEHIQISNLDSKFPYMGLVCDNAADNAHPGIKSHVRIAEKLYENIKTNVLY